jgi:hypothetical protein
MTANYIPRRSLSLTYCFFKLIIQVGSLDRSKMEEGLIFRPNYVPFSLNIFLLHFPKNGLIR